MEALVISFHALFAFSAITWMGVRIPIVGSAPPAFAGVSSWFIYFCNTFFMYILLLLSGCFVPRLVDKRGVLNYLYDRLWRLGIPFLAGLLLIINASYLLGRLSQASPLIALAWTDMSFNCLSVLWFLVVLFFFVFDLLYCDRVTLQGNHSSIDPSGPTPQFRFWLASAVVLATLEVLMTT